MAPLTFACSSCNQLLEYEQHEIGSAFQCPGCGLRGTLPDVHTSEDEAVRRKNRRRRRGWRKVRVGVTLLLGSWVMVTLCTTILAGAVVYQLLGLMFAITSGELNARLYGVLALLTTLTEFGAVAGWWLCLKAPADSGVRTWAWIALGLAIPRTCTCLVSGLVLSLADKDSNLPAMLFTTAAALLFFAHWIVCVLMAADAAAARGADWLTHAAHKEMRLVAAAALGWLALAIAVPVITNLQEVAYQNMILTLIPRLFCGLGVVLLTLAFWYVVFLHLRLLIHLRYVLDT